MNIKEWRIEMNELLDRIINEIAQFCENTPSCSSCPFNDGQNGCMLIKIMIKEYWSEYNENN